MTEGEVLIDAMNQPARCGYCGDFTNTKEWDCEICGFSKQHPDGFDLVRDIEIDVRSTGTFGSVMKVTMTHKPTGMRVYGEIGHTGGSKLKTQLLRELNQKVKGLSEDQSGENG